MTDRAMVGCFQMAMVCSVSDGYPMVGLSSLQHVLTFYV